MATIDLYHVLPQRVTDLQSNSEGVEIIETHIDPPVTLMYVEGEKYGYGYETIWFTKRDKNGRVWKEFKTCEGKRYPL